MLRKTMLFLGWMLYLTAGAVRGQGSQTVSPPKDGEASLDATMKSIQDKMNGRDQIAYVLTHSTTPGVSFRVQEHISDVVADPAACTLRAADTIVTNVDVPDGTTFSNAGKPLTDDDLHTRKVITSTISLKNVENVTVESMQDHVNRFFSKETRREITITVVPSVFYLVASASKRLFSFHISKTQGNKSSEELDKSDNEVFYIFGDEKTANRIAKALTQAVGLCGGGNKDPS